jgi:dephospho-CoA kinase
VIIGIGGTNGAGKDVVAQLLAEKHGFLFVGATEMFLEELQARQWPTDRQHKAKLSAEWRRELGMAAIVDKALAIYNSHPKGTYKGLVVGSLRHPGEVDRIHELHGIVLWIDADPQLRYKRIITANRGRELEDNKSFEEFLADEQREMTPSGDAATLNMAAVKERADQVLLNNYSNTDDLAQALAKVVDISSHENV